MRRTGPWESRTRRHLQREIESSFDRERKIIDSGGNLNANGGFGVERPHAALHADPWRSAHDPPCGARSSCRGARSQQWGLLPAAATLDSGSVCSRRPRRSIPAVEPAPGGRGARFRRGLLQATSNRPVGNGIESSTQAQVEDREG